MEESLPGLAKGKGTPAVLKAMTVTFGLWQVSKPAEAGLGPPPAFRLDFARELPRMLRSQGFNVDPDTRQISGLNSRPEHIKKIVEA